MGTGAKILVGVAVLGAVSYIGYTNYYNMPSLVSKSGKKMTIKFRGKNIVVDVDSLSQKGESLMLSGMKWHLSPSYGNQSDKKTLNGLFVMDSRDVIHRTVYF